MAIVLTALMVLATVLVALFVGPSLLILAAANEIGKTLLVFVVLLPFLALFALFKAFANLKAQNKIVEAQNAAGRRLLEGSEKWEKMRIENPEEYKRLGDEMNARHAELRKQHDEVERLITTFKPKTTNGTPSGDSD